QLRVTLTLSGEPTSVVVLPHPCNTHALRCAWEYCGKGHGNGTRGAPLYGTNHNARGFTIGVPPHHPPPSGATHTQRAVAEKVPRPSPPHRASHSAPDRKSTRLNSSHVKISYAVFCLK